MVYLIVKLKFAPAREADFLQTLQEEYLPLVVEKYDWKLIASWKTQIGDIHETLNIWSFERIEDFWNVRMAMFEDPEYARVRNKIHGMLTDEVISFATPLSYSPM